MSLQRDKVDLATFFLVPRPYLNGMDLRFKQPRRGALLIAITNLKTSKLREERPVRTGRSSRS